MNETHSMASTLYRSTNSPGSYLLRVLLSLLLTMGIALPLNTQAGPRHERFAAGRILVTPRHSVDEAQFITLTVRHGGKAHKRLRATRLRIVDVAPGQEQATVQALSQDPRVESAEVDRLVDPEVTAANDTYYANAWHLAKMGTPIAWDTAKGAGVTVAILDSGVDSTHPDLAGKLVPGWNLVDNNSNTSDVYGHGTMVAGVVSAASNNGLGVTSIAWDASIMPVRVALTSGSAYISTIADGIIYAADHGAQIANASFATLTGSPSIQNAANYMRSKGGLVVVAAGNYGVLDSTANTSAVISVSATGSSDALTGWSSYGPYVDVSAPGSSIMTTTKGGGYSAVSGTSFSSPATCAVLALMKSANPTLSNVTLETLLKSTAVDLGTPGNDQYYGYGRINADAAVTAAATYNVAADTQAPTVSISSPTGGTVSSTLTVNVAASDNIGVTRVDLYNGATLIASSSTAPYSINWDTKTVADGAATLAAFAYDKAGNKGSSANVFVTVRNAIDSTTPTVSILSPTSGTVTGTVNVNVSASDNVGVTQVDLYVGTTLIGSRNTTPYTFTWDTRSVANGTQTLTAYANDKAGNRGRSTTVSVNVSNVAADTTAPTVTILSPIANRKVSGSVTVSASASDNVGVTKVDLYVGTTLIGSRSTTPYTFIWDTRSVANGTQTLTAYATDTAGNRGRSKTVSVKVANVIADTIAPTVTILSPAANSNVSGSVTVKASASDNIRVTSLAVFIDGTLKASTSKSSLSYKWNTRDLSIGTHTITVRTNDAAGNAATKSINVTYATSTTSKSGTSTLTKRKRR